MMDKTLIVLVAHDPMAQALKSVATHVFEQANAIITCDVLADDEPERVEKKLYDDIKQQYKVGQNILIFSDLIGATPSNIAVRLMQSLEAEGIHAEMFTGTNVCMLLTAVRYADLPLTELKPKILEGGEKGMKNLNCSCH